MQDALMADCDLLCAFCGYAASAEDAAEFYIANSIGGSRDFYKSEGDEYPLRNCPNCDNQTLVFEEGYTGSDGICFVCGDTPSRGEYVSCDQCQELCRREDLSGGMCTECLTAYISEDHR